MSELPCVGAGITVVDPGPSSDEVWGKRKDGRPSAARKRRSSRTDIAWRAVNLPPRLLKAYVTESADVDPNPSDRLGRQIIWKCGVRYGSVFEGREGIDWTRGHGPQARGALLAQRALEQR